MENVNQRKPKAAMEKFSSILMKYPDSLPAQYGKAKSLDSLAELQRSNAILDQAIAEYLKILSFPKPVPDDLFLKVAERCIDRMRFKE